MAAIRLDIRVKIMAKERFNVMGKELTANEKAVYEFVRDNGVVDYKMVAEKLNISPKSASSTDRKSVV